MEHGQAAARSGKCQKRSYQRANLLTRWVDWAGQLHVSCNNQLGLCQPLLTWTSVVLGAQAGTSGRSTPSSSTVYTLRLTTSWDRGSAMSEPMAGVHVCLIGKNGSAVLHRITPVNDPMDRLNMMRDICSSVSAHLVAGLSRCSCCRQALSQHTVSADT